MPTLTKLALALFLILAPAPQPRAGTVKGEGGSPREAKPPEISATPKLNATLTPPKATTLPQVSAASPIPALPVATVASPATAAAPEAAASGAAASAPQASADLPAVLELRRLGERLRHRPANHAQTFHAAYDNASNEGWPEEGALPKQHAAAPASLAPAPIKDLLARGIPGDMDRVVEGELLFWRHKQKQVDPYLAAPGDADGVVAAKTRNELKALLTVWLGLRPALESKASPQALARVDALVIQAKAEVEREKLKAEVVVERLVAPVKSSDDEDVRAAASLAKTDLIPALQSRQSLLYLTAEEEPHLDLAAFHEDLKRLEKERLATKVFERFLRAPFGFDAVSPRRRDEERQLAKGKRLMVGAQLLSVLAGIDAGKPAEQALQETLKSLSPTLASTKEKMLRDPENAQIERLFNTLAELTTFLQAVQKDLRSYDYVYEFSDIPAAAEAKKRAVFERHKRAWAEMLGGATQPIDPRTASVLEELRAHMSAAILKEGRPLQYAAAQFLRLHEKRLEKLNVEINPRDPTKPPRDEEGPLDLLMRYCRAAARGGAQAPAVERDLVIAAPEIRDETDFEEMMTAFHAHGRVVAILTLGAPAPGEDDRIPHWVIFSGNNGIVPLPWAVSPSGLSPSELERRLESAGDHPATAIVDGKRGEALINPSKAARAEWLERGSDYQALADYYRERARLPAVFEAAPVRLLADASDPEKLQAQAVEAGKLSELEASGVSGVGLLRMEELMGKLRVEWDAARLAGELAAILENPLFRGGAPLVVRLFDFEGDKVPKFLEETRPGAKHKLLKTHSNVRFYLDKTMPDLREFGKMQLKAIFEARRRAVEDPWFRERDTRVLFSNVRGAEEIIAIEKLVDEAAAEYAAEQTDPSAARDAAAQVAIGYMIEDVATVANLKPFMAEIARLKRERPAGRFLAFGTNDYLLSLLKGGRKDTETLSRLNPREIHGIWQVATAAAAEKIELTIDGKWGSSPKMMLALLALRKFHGVEATAVAYLPRAPELKDLARSATLEDIRELSELIARIPTDSPPTARELDDAAAAAVARIEDRARAALKRP